VRKAIATAKVHPEPDEAPRSFRWVIKRTAQCDLGISNDSGNSRCW